MVRKPLRGSVDGGGETRRSSANDDRVVVLEARNGLKAKLACELPRLWPDERRAVGEPQRRAIALRRRLPGPVVGQIGVVRREPGEGDLVALEKTAKIEAAAIPTVSEQDDLSAARLRRNLLQSADTLASVFVH